MKNYEVMDVLEVGDAGEVIEGPKEVILDELAGNEGPARDSLEDE
jgi:hypothetical protein